MENDEEIKQIKREHFIMRRALERIWLMHETAMTKDESLPERLLYLNVSLAIKKSKSRSTSEMGIEKVGWEAENSVMFKVGLINDSGELK